VKKSEDDVQMTRKHKNVTQYKRVYTSMSPLLVTSSTHSQTC